MTVRIGQCFTKVGMPFHDVWQVSGMVGTPGCSGTHVRLTRIDHPADQKTVSLAALQDARLYRAHDGSLVLRRRLEEAPGRGRRVR